LKDLLKYLLRRTYQPALVKYLSRTRTYLYRDIVLQVPKEVFHPGFFFSTKLLLKYLGDQPLKQKSLLELGAGSGLISIYAAKKGASVVATDINPKAIECLAVNGRLNGVQLDILYSDLFENIPKNAFDVIAINPPYYKKNPQNAAEYAWFCGEHGEYFELLFRDLADYIHDHSMILMVLCDGCDRQMIREMACRNGFDWECVVEERTILEKNFIYSIRKTDEHFPKC
jgi:release factor glutamine methyltransferase